MKLEFLISSVAFLSGFGKSQGQNQCISLQTSTQCYEYKSKFCVKGYEECCLSVCLSVCLSSVSCSLACLLVSVSN